MTLRGKNVLVIGLARSGMAAIKVLKELGANITLSETKPKSEIEQAQALEEFGIKIIDQSLQVFEGDFDLVVKNPGVPYKSEKIQLLESRNIPVITEIELAFQAAKPQNYIAITGTNGKTTTVSLMGEILKKAYGEKAHVCGNIGIPLCEIVMNENLMNESDHYIALEISNFQLVNIDKFAPKVATIINLTPDHMDFMGSLEEYYKSKIQVYRNMTKDDTFILNSDDPIVLDYTKKYPIPCKVKSFSIEGKNTDIKIIDGFITYCGEKVLALSNIKLVGKHNLQNVIIAVSMAKVLGISNEIIAQAVSEFTGVEHRIEFVREVNGVKYYNDSKGTNTDATITALKAFDRGVILLVGGFEKGLSMEEMKKYLCPVKKVIGFGACGERLVKELVGDDGIVVTTLDEAVEQAKNIAQKGDTVLLSPTTSSFDQYSCFEERGEHFKQIVNSI